MKTIAYKLAIVDDERIIREGLRNIIEWEDMGFEVANIFADGGEVIDYIQKNPLDVILTDIKMTFTSGIQVAKYVYEHKPEIKVVLISGHKEFELAVEAMKYGVEDYILKPTDISKLEETFNAIKIKLDKENELLHGLSIDGLSNKNVASEHANSIEEEIGNVTENSFNVEGKSLKLIAQAKRYIKENCTNDISLEEVAEHLYLSPVYFSKIFKQNTGENFIDYVVKLKINKAMEFLSDTKYKTYEISDMVGYKSTRYFSRLFKLHTGFTPSEYRKSILVDGDDEIDEQ